MEGAEERDQCWAICHECRGQGSKRRRLSPKARRRHENALRAFEEKKGAGVAPERPKGHLEDCSNCGGTGLLRAKAFPLPDRENYPELAIIGGGIGGMALAVACLHRGIPFTLYERDSGFDARSQGYGLTLQQGGKAVQGLGIPSLHAGVISTRHMVHTPDGEVLGEWGVRKWLGGKITKAPKRTNIHIARQSLRLALLEQLGGPKMVQWGHELLAFKKDEGGQVALQFQTESGVKQTRADLVVGADGIRSVVRMKSLGEERSPLRYLGCIVILGICPLEDFQGVESPLLDSATVFQTANGCERIYMMPYDSTSVMWQLSFPMPEDEAKALSARGSQALKEEAHRRVPWHDPIPQVLVATPASRVTGYPVYDRSLLQPEWLEKAGQVTLLGDAAHPMSPFKGQGANQALLDALGLARAITRGCRDSTNWTKVGIRESVLKNHESEMLERSAIKVRDSAEAAKFLHSDVVLHEGDEPRGRCLQRVTKTR